MILVLLTSLPAPADDEPVIAATAETRLAYVLTGLNEIDEISRAGLDGLSLVLNRRTAVEAGDPRAVNLALDDLNLFPLLYWPIPSDHPNLRPEVLARLDDYLRQGGMILFDTGDAGALIPGQPGPGPGERRLRELLAGLNIPPLQPVPEDHTLTRSFYLLQDFPGRWTGRTVWVDQTQPGVNDGVSSMIIGSHDWSGAWAVDEFGLADVSGPAGRGAAARGRAPLRRQPRDVCADRQLQDRSGARAGFVGAAGPVIDGTSLTFAPLLPLPLIALLAAAVVVVVALGLWRRARGIVWRAAMLGLGILALANPVGVREQRQPLDDVVVVLVDRSPSQTIAERPEQIEATLTELRQELEGVAELEVVEVEAGGESENGTRLFKPLGTTLAEIDRQRLAAVLVLSDGQIHDVPANLDRLGIAAPMHLLLTGRPDETDRRLLVEQVPAYGMVGDQHEITLRVDQLPGTAAGGPVTVTLRQDGEVRQRLSLPTGVPRTLPFELDRAGQTVLEVEAETGPDELTALNNRQAFFINGVRDRLRVLLVSGQPYPGLRVWRNLLKADPAVDLVHFTILRPPEKQDGTPIRELALIAFPSRELFEVKLGEFDLVIFDRYSRRGLLPLAYLDNVARYVEEGGALLEIAGPEFAHPLSLYRTPLARVLPGRPSGVVYERGFTPTLTELGDRHPVTGGLTPRTVTTRIEAEWGRWFRQVDVEVSDSQVLMNGVAERPLLVLSRIGEGRVAQLLSDHPWLWARGFEGGGPQGLCCGGWSTG